MPFKFNPTKKSDDKGLGKIHIDDNGTATSSDAAAAQVKAEEAAAATRKKWILGGGVAGLALVVGLATVFSGASKNDNAPAPQPTQQTQTQQPTQPQYQEPQGQYTAPAATASQLLQQSIRAKESVIYRDESSVFHDKAGRLAEAYLTIDGREVPKGQDFAVHAQLFNKGGFSLLIASGPYAGTRLEIFPVNNGGGSRFTYTKAGQEAVGSDGKTVVFQALPSSQRMTQTVSMKSPAQLGSGVQAPSNGWTFEQMGQGSKGYTRAFELKGAPDDGVFSVKLWNDDTFTFNLKTGDYTFDSVFLYHPNYLQTGESVKGTPVVNGAMNIAPAAAPVRTSKPGL
jgi:hypothetical protein